MSGESAWAHDARGGDGRPLAERLTSPCIRPLFSLVGSELDSSSPLFSTMNGGMSYCQNCGTGLDAGVNFCPKCGQQIAAAPAPTAAPVAPKPSVQAATASKASVQQKAKRRPRLVLLVFTLGLWASVPWAIRLWRRGNRGGAIAIGVANAFVLVILIAALASGNKTSPSAGAQPASSTTATSAVSPAPAPAPAPKKLTSKQKYIRDHGADANRVQANILLVTIAVTQAKTSGDLTAVAEAAQTAHDNLNNIRQDFATTSSISCPTCSLGDAALELFTAANDLKNSMGALVSYTGNPNPATLAHFNSQYGTAKTEWDEGVNAIWGGRKDKPTL